MSLDSRMATLWLGVMLVLASSPSIADDVIGSTEMLCTVAQATRCYDDGDCAAGPPWRWNIPHFIVIDFEQGQLRTTKVSGERGCR
ncbi:MAG: hypothetical protein GY906_38355 [bacterium]|nr:hypothetical protein [bacterium]